MADGLVLPPGAGHRIQGAGMTLKIGAEQSGRWSAFEAEVAPGFDVGAHRHAEAEEIFYLLEGELDLSWSRRPATSGTWRGSRSCSAIPGRRIRPRSSSCGPASTSSSSHP